MPTWKEIEEKYGKDRADKMRECPYLECITVTLLPSGESDIPQCDIDLAYRWSRGEKIGPEDWD